MIVFNNILNCRQPPLRYTDYLHVCPYKGHTTSLTHLIKGFKYATLAHHGLVSDLQSGSDLSCHTLPRQNSIFGRELEIDGNRS